MHAFNFHEPTARQRARRFAISLVGLLFVPLWCHGQSAQQKGPQLILPPGIRATPTTGSDGVLYALSGAATEDEFADPARESDGRGILLKSDAPNGAASWQVTGINSGTMGRWFSLRVRGMAEEGFKVREDKLFLRVDFRSEGGKRSLDEVTKSIYPQVERDRTNLADKQTNRNLGSATWRNYMIQFRLPFPEIDTLRLSVGFSNGAGEGAKCGFRVNEMELSAIPTPSDYVSPPNKGNASDPAKPPAMDTLVPLGGRWYYDPRGGPKTAPKEIGQSNSNRLLYLTDRLEAPFGGNMSAWRRKGYLDRNEKMVEEDSFVPDNVIITFTDTHMIVKSHNLPNHPTAVFPDRWRLLDGNPNYIKEQDFTWYIPLVPKENPSRVAMDATNSNRALPGGAIGVAVNGIIFHNPYDELVEMEAVWRTDRCCGHPSPLQTYHYHKYPVCVNTPWADDGEAHSPLIGFAFDGYPVYGPYESRGVMAQHSTTNPLNEFNVHRDDARGWHYHVTPGKYPNIIGGFWGALETKNRSRRGPPPGPTGPPGQPRRF